MDDRHRRILNVVLIVTLAVSLLSIGYLAMTPVEQEGEPYTELYVLGPDGNASDYPLSLEANETGSIVVGIANREHAPMTYTVVMTVNQEVIAQEAVPLAVDERSEEQYSISIDEAGRYDLKIVLYEGEPPTESTEPYRELQLVISVS